MKNLSTQNNNPDSFYVPKDKSSLPKKSLFYIVVLFFLFLIFYFSFLSAPKNFPIRTAVVIEQGEILRSVSGHFKEQNVIKSRIVFEAFVIIYGGEKHITAGDYLFENKASVIEVAKRVAQREINLAPVKVTIPEGFTNQEIADLFSTKLRNFDENRFLEDAKLQQGYLFPDTYFFFTSDDDQKVLDYMTSNFEKRIKTIQKDFLTSSRTEKDLITMASIIEKEAKGDSDRALISGILWNRISKNMALQVDADMWTYKNRGLPVSPICNPGLEAIKAAIFPTKSAYLYYLHDPEGGIHFAKTFEEHKNNKAKYLK